EAGPLIRATLMRLAEEEHILFLTVHHIICDGWSSAVIVDELGALYGAAHSGSEADLPEPMQFREYAAWLEEFRDSKDWQAAEEHWRAQGAQAYPVSDMPADGIRPPVKTYGAERATALIDVELLDQLRTRAAEEGQTLFTFVLSAFEAYLHRLSGQPEIALGVSIAGHTQFPDSPLVGHCVNMLPLRRTVNAESSFRDHLQTTRSALLDAFEHQNYGYGTIVRNMTSGRDPSRTPLVSVVFNMDAAVRSLDFGDLEAVSGSSPRKFENFDVFVNLVGSGDGLVVEWTCNPDLFSAESVRIRLDGFLELLRGLAEGVDQPVSALALLSGRELGLLEEWNATSVEYEAGLTLVELFERQVARSPDAVALVFGELELSYAELNQRANQLARWLVDVGVGAESLVGVLMERSVEMVVALYAVLKAGGAYVPLDPEYPEERLGIMVGEAGLAAILTQETLAELVPVGSHEVMRVDSEWGRVEDNPGTDLELAIDEDTAAYVIYTSGSTGRPKGVLNTHRGIVNRLLWMQDHLGLVATDRVLQKTPFSFDVSVWEFFWPLQVGARLIVAEPGGHQDPGYLVRVINEHEVSTLHFVPSMLRLFLDDARLRACASLRRVVCSGEALTFDLQERFFEVFDGVELHNLYGPTEAAVDVTFWECDAHDRSGVVPIGRPVSNTQIHVLDEQLGRVPIGVAGELHIGGVQVARGYVNRPELTDERFIGDVFSDGRLYKSGDLARWRIDGNVEFLGRTDHQVKIRGNRVELGEIEAVLLQHPTVSTTAVTTHTEANGDQRLVAHVSTLADGQYDESDMREFLKAQLPMYMVPNVFVEHDAFALTTSGKIDRGVLPAPDLAERPAGADHVAPRTPMEQQIADIWAELLGRERVGVEDDFFELGGHSLDAMRANARIYSELGVELSLGSMFEHPTVAELALLVTSLLAEEQFDEEELLALVGELAEGDGAEAS
ncbi:MAG: non-ribosomal peptide synthetase, partial [Gaiellaceae bacterium]